MTSLENTEDVQDGHVDTERKEDTGPSFVETALPIPDFFYDVRATLPLIGSSPGKVRALTNVIYLVTIGVFIATYAYYSLPAQLLSEEIIISSEWQKTGYVCKPLQKATIHGFSTDWGYDECVAAVAPPSADSVNAATKHLDATHFDYEFASDGDANNGVLSFYDARYESSVLQLATNAWKREGYSCFPEPPYQGRTYNVPYNYTECFDEILEPSSETVKLAPSTFTSSSELAASYFPFGILRVGTNEGVATVHTSMSQIQTLLMRGSGPCSYYPVLPSSGLSFLSYDCFVYKMDGCIFLDINLSEGIDGWQEI